VAHKQSQRRQCPVGKEGGGRVCSCARSYGHAIKEDLRDIARDRHPLVVALIAIANALQFHRATATPASSHPTASTTRTTTHTTASAAPSPRPRRLSLMLCRRGSLPRCRGESRTDIDARRYDQRRAVAHIAKAFATIHQMPADKKAQKSANGGIYNFKLNAHINSMITRHELSIVS